MQWIGRTVLGIALLYAGSAWAQGGALGDDGAAGGVRPGQGVEVGEPVTPVSIDVDLRSLPTLPEWKPGDPIREAQKRQYYPLDLPRPHAPSDWPTAPDRLPELQELWDQNRGAGSELRHSGRVTIDNGSTGVSPGDPVVEVNASYVLYGVNASSGTSFTVYDKSGTRIAGPTAFKSLAPAGDPCATSVSDPIILYDRLANRWFMLEMGGTSSANRLCVYVSKTDNPVSGGWWFYGFATPALPDYPHCAVWTNAYVCTTNESGAGAKVYAFDRANMLNGATARPAQRFTSVPKLSGYGFQALTPATFMGLASAAPPSGAAPILARHNDDEAHAGTSANTSADFIDLYQLNVDWNNAANSSITTLPRITITEFNSWFQNYSDFATVPQPGSTAKLDPIREVILNSLVYRNLGGQESIVGTFATNQNPARSGTVVDAGVRWFELRRSGGGWSLHQEGTFSPGDSNTHHLLGTIATDRQGNIGLGYNVTKTSSPTIAATLRYTGRLAGDPLGVMTQGETDVAVGSAVETSGRWGDYYQMTVDPADDCTFWFVGMYRPAGSWATRIRDFRFSSCGGAPATYSVSGRVTTSAGVGVSGVTIGTGSVSTTTDSNGNYTLGNLANGSYTLTPSRSGYSFTPASRSVTVNGSNLIGQDFTAAPVATTFTISGRVTNGGGAGLSGVVVSTGSASATTNGNGDYSIANLANGTYTLTPSLSGYTFTPASRSVTVNGANVGGQDFSGTVASGSTALSNGVPVNGTVNSSSTNGAFREYTVAIPSGASNLTIATSNASGDVDLYVRFGSAPTLSSYDCRPYTGSGNESCNFANPSVGTYFVRVYGYATGNISFTITATWSTGGGGGGATERLLNGNFDSITASTNSAPDGSWSRTAFSGTSHNTLVAGATDAHSGSAYAMLGVNNSAGQTVESRATPIPTGATSATLSFQTSIVTSETTTSTAYDRLFVELVDASNNQVLASLVTLSNLNRTTSASSYVLRSFDVLAHRGKSVKIRFRSSNDGSLPTTFRVDTVSLRADG